MEYLLKASTVVAIFYICYKLFLQRETFFESNRWFLLVGLVVAFAIPFIVIPIYINVEPNHFQNLMETGDTSAMASTEEPFDFLQLIAGIYLLGLIFFLGKFLLQFGSLGFLLLHNDKSKSGRFTFIKTKSNASPFSFFKWIVYNPTQFNKDELAQILTHEKVHARQYHSIDIVLTQLASIIFWFNPFIWLYKKELHQNLEFIADQNTQEQVDCKKTYQHLLLKTSVPNYEMALTNNFYNSLIKKRIVMLHKNRSQNKKQWKYALVIPVLALFLMSFNTKEVLMYNDFHTSDSIIDDGAIEERLINKDFSDADLEKVKKELSDKGVKLKFSGVKRNPDNEIIAIKIEAKLNGANANFNTNADSPIDPIVIKINTENNKISIGNSHTNTLHHGDGYVYEIKDGKTNIHKSGKGNNVFVYSHSDDDHDGDHEIIESDGKIVIKKGNKVHELKKMHKGKNTVVISDGDGEVIELKGEAHSDGNVFIYKKDKKGKILKEHKDKDGNIEIWTGDDDNTFKVKTIGKGKGGNKIFISGGDDANPLYILDGKEISKKQMKNLDSEKIKSIHVLKGKSATKKYGKKAKDGVVEISTKDKD
jgi:hypothetical protein